MNRMWTLAALAALTLLPAAATSQEPRPRARPRARTRVEGPFGYSFSGNHGRIGVLVKTDADSVNDKVGARIEGVTPGGPADKAGLKSGDIITKFNGTALGGARAEDEDESGPGMKLIDLAHELDPGDTVQVEYRRGTDARKATIVADEVEMGAMTAIKVPGFEFNGPMELGGEPGKAFSFAFGSPWGGVELVTLNPDLGEYFGTREGVLVIKVSGDTTLPLKAGDVIQAIGGRKPTSPEHAMRILRSYDTGETVSLDVLRKQKRTTLTWKVPEEGRRFRTVFPRMREEPSALRWRVAPRIESSPRMRMQMLPKVRRALTLRAI